LNAEGIRTLATGVFSLEQGIAASQSGCLFISPYYNGNATKSNLHEGSVKVYDGIFMYIYRN
jgi:transaldolase